MVFYNSGCIFTSQNSNYANIGQITIASWIATSSNANGTKLLNTLNLKKGIYIIAVTCPIINPQQDFICAPYINNQQLTNYYLKPLTEQSQSFVIQLSADSTIDIKTATAASFTFTYIERGRIEAVKIK